MTTEGAFTAARAALSLYGGLFKDVAQEIGLEKAVALHARQAGAFDALLAGMIRQRLGDKEIDLTTFAAIRQEALAVLGMTAQIEELANSVTLTCRECPLYEGLRMAGLEHATIEALCQRGVVVGYAQLNKAFPQLSGALRFRTAPDQPCVEEFTLMPPRE